MGENWFYGSKSGRMEMMPIEVEVKFKECCFRGSVRQ